MSILRARVLTPDPDGPGESPITWLDDAVVHIEGGRIVSVDAYTDQDYDDDIRPDVLLPGFVDSHLHYPQTRIIGSASGPLLQWLQLSTFPEESRFSDNAHAHAIAQAFTACLAAAGTTLSMVYASAHYQATDTLFHAMDQRGLRCIAGPVLMDRDSPPALTVPVDPAMHALERLIDDWHGHDDRLQVAVIPRFALSCTSEMMARAGRLANDRGLWVSTHLSENTSECEAACSIFGTHDYLEIYERAGMVHERSVYAHCIHMSEDEWRRFADAKATVAHCPDSNAFLGSGHMPTQTVLDHGIPLTIGTDVAGGRSFRIPKILSSAYDNALVTGTTIAPATLLWWGTLSGARALGHSHVGAIAAGFEADMVQIEVPAWAHTAEDVLAWTLFYADAPAPRRTWVRGQLVWDRAAHSGPFPWSDLELHKPDLPTPS
ncbi:MAG: guanine deaminase [Kiritimatiellia bacterium]|jgi:guanine deaminase